MKLTDYDHLSIRCPMLGHPVPFSYCRSLNAALPCRKILDCWFQHFDVISFVETMFTPEEIASFLSPPQPKINQLLELIEKARNQGS
ncbi:MAG TPA: hypothetical protein ENN34_01425 [Deltaproteobacteria bacterium]|nr:hypothetical protein [Deltaproteobacteria bacterium]